MGLKDKFSGVFRKKGGSGTKEIFCPECNSKNPYDAKFCQNCSS